MADQHEQQPPGEDDEDGEHPDGARVEGEAPDASPGEEASGKADKGSRFGPLLGVLGFLAALAGGFYIGQVIQERNAGPWSGYEDLRRYRVELGGHEPQWGPDDALVTIIEFSDYECPFCQRAHEPLMDALDDHDDVRLLFKHLPLPMHANAIPAARAAWAAQQQGKFWEMHEYLFSVGGKLGELEQAARDMGLDVERFTADMASPAATEAIEADRRAGGVLGIGSTPHFVINGRHVRGALARNHWDKAIEQAREDALALVEAGTPRAGVYEAMMEGAATTRARRPDGPDPSKRHPVRPDGRPALGPEDALVTVVEFSDFQCPYCARLAPVMHALPERHPDVRVVVRQFPMPGHDLARPAALAALAAERQGRFWEMHDGLFALGGKLTEGDIDRIAEEIGLDMARFGQDREDPALATMVAEDEALARELGLRGRPASFVNGRFLSGAQPAEQFDAAIEKEREAARALVEQGTPPGEVLDALLQQEQGG